MASGMRRREFLRSASVLGAAAAVFGAERAIGVSRVQPAQRVAPKPSRVAPRFSLAYLTLFGCPPPEMTYIAARAGYDFVSFRPIYMGLPGEPNFELSANPQLLRQTRTALASTGLRVLDIELARVADGADPKKYLPAMEVGAELGAKHVISSIWTDDRVFATESFAQLCDLARPLGLTINLEFVTFASVRTLREALDVLRAARRENCGVLVDTLHFSRSRVVPAELSAVPREWFHFVHLCDAPAEIPATTEGLIRTAREERLYAGEGGIDLDAILGPIPDVPYSLEIPHSPRVKELGFAEHAFRCLQTARDYLRARA
jgi:sugar phosphate isomerase/epimerase